MGVKLEDCSTRVGREEAAEIEANNDEPEPLIALDPLESAGLVVRLPFADTESPPAAAALDSGGESLFLCGQCGVNFPSARQLGQHTSKSACCRAAIGGPGSKFACDTCGLWLANKSTLELHLRSHAGYRPFACDKCDKTFTSATYLRQHSVFHNAAKEFECEVCGKRYQNANSLHQHRKDSHSSPAKVACPVCGKIFAALRYLTEHQTRKHSAGFQRPACPVCGKTFAGRAELATHQTVHTGERPYGCSLCGKRFRLKSVLRMHARVHAGERRAVCDTCGKRFLQASDLNKHKLAAHSGEKPFVCDLCSRPFARRDYLKAHMKVHQQPPPPLLAEENGINPISIGGVKRTARTRKPRNSRHLTAVDMLTGNGEQEQEEAGYSPDDAIEQGLILDVPMALSSIVEGSETLLVVTNLDDSKDLVIEEFKAADSLMNDTSSFL
jgi:uncharacterized Zn-finger protein